MEKSSEFLTRAEYHEALSLRLKFGISATYEIYCHFWEIVYTKTINKFQSLF
jgi:hypothetical protein